MKLIITVVHDRDTARVSGALRSAGYGFTVMASTGGFLRQGNVTLMIGAEPDAVADVLRLIDENCHTREQFVNVLPPDAGSTGAFLPTPISVSVGGAVAFVVDVEQFHKF